MQIYLDLSEQAIWPSGYQHYLQILFPTRLMIKTTVKILNIWTPQKFAVITLKFEQDGFTKE